MPTVLPDAPIGGNNALVGLPNAYDQFGLYSTVDKEEKKQVRQIYANDAALSSKGDASLERGSILVMEIYGAQLDADDMPIADSLGRFVKDELKLVFVMEKKEGFGQYSDETKNGEWEYGAYTATGEAAVNDLDCNDCHGENAGADLDWVFSKAALASWRTALAPIGGNPDKIVFPTDYPTYALATTVDKEEKKQVRKIYGNDVAIDIAATGSGLARGSKVVMEIYSAQLDADDSPIMNGDGRFMEDELLVIAVMEKQAGFGNYTDETRNGEWEYKFFTPSGEPMASELDCFGCHLENAGPSVDFLFSFDALEQLR